MQVSEEMVKAAVESLYGDDFFDCWREDSEHAIEYVANVRAALEAALSHAVPDAQTQAHVPEVGDWNAAIAAAIMEVEQTRDKHSSPTGDSYTCGLWDQSQRIIGKLQKLAAAPAPVQPVAGGERISRDRDIIFEAISSYDTWNEETEFDARRVLDDIIKRMKWRLSMTDPRALSDGKEG